MSHLLGTVALATLISYTSPVLAKVLHGTLFKSQYCTCCEGHAEYLRDHDISLIVKPVENLDKVRANAGIPSTYEGCHTILLGDYVIEGHVAIDLIHKLLTARPADVVGLALPGMPTGVPGMGGTKTGRYEVYAIRKDGSATVFGTQ